MNDQTKKWTEYLNRTGHTLLIYFATWISLVFCYRAGEMNLLDDKTVCKTVYSILPVEAEPVVSRFIPYGGEQ